MKTLIEEFRIFPGDHCGSVAMRGLLAHYCDLELPEPAVFGLGSGVASVYINGPDADPPAVLFGRTISMEQDLGQNLQLDYREQPEADDDEAWRVVREEVREGRPTMLSGDIFYLDYRDYKIHFPAHRFILLGFDDEASQVFIGDRIRDEAETCSLGAVRLSRNPPEGMSTRNLWGRFHDTQIGRPLREAAEIAIARCAQSMLAPAESAAPATGPGETPGVPGAGLVTPPRSRVVSGVEATRAFAHDLPGLRERDDATWIAQFNASCIEKFGNGGGNFRRLYSGFLGWARALDPSLVPEPAPALAMEAADAWTATSSALFEASEAGARPAAWDEAARHAERAAEIETRLFTMLADGAG